MRESGGMRPSWPSAAPYIAAVLALPVVYLLSLGPGVWLSQRDLIPDSMLHTANLVFEPAIWLCDTFPDFGKAYGAYLDWFVPP